MIKINLLKSVGATTHTSVGGSDLPAFSASGSTKGKAIAKVLVLFLVPVGLYIYDEVVKSGLEKAIAETQAHQKEVVDARAKFGDTGVKMEGLSKEKKEIDGQVDSIRTIARLRLREVKSLDALQSLLSTRTWLNKVKIENTTIRMIGYTNGDDGISELIRGLENSSFFSHVDPKSTSEEKIGSTIVKKFELEFRVGKQVQE